MPMYYIKDRANPVNEMWSDDPRWVQPYKDKLKFERDRLNREFPPVIEGKFRFVIGEMK